MLLEIVTASLLITLLLKSKMSGLAAMKLGVFEQFLISGMLRACVIITEVREVSAVPALE
jgi:hypothetical protein